jgi:hypothetical protein
VCLCTPAPACALTLTSTPPNLSAPALPRRAATPPPPSKVVAGTNYFLELSLKDAKGKARSVQAQVFQPLPSVANAGPQLTGYLAL